MQAIAGEHAGGLSSFWRSSSIRGAGFGRQPWTPLCGYMHLGDKSPRQTRDGRIRRCCRRRGSERPRCGGSSSVARLVGRGDRTGTEPGGAVKTREVTLPGFLHDLYAMNLSLFAGSSFFAAYKEELTAQGLAFAPATDCFASVFRDHQFLGVSKDLDKTSPPSARCRPRTPRRGGRWSTVSARKPRTSSALLGSPMPSLASLRAAVWAAWRTKGSAFLADLGRLCSRPRAISSTPISKRPS